MIQPALMLNEAQGTMLATLAARLQNRDSLPPLAPKEPWNEGLEGILSGTDEEELVGGEVKDPEYARAVKSGLLLWNDSLNESHNLSQDLHSATGSYLHGIMHRREPDFSNAKYWFRRVGDHPIFSRLREQAIGVFNSAAETSEYAKTRLQQVEGNDQWDPFAFVDWCEEAIGQSDHDLEATYLLEAVQQREIELLITYAYRQAVGLPEG